MKSKIITILFLSLFFGYYLSPAQQISKRVLSDWTFKINNENSIHKATVPGDVQSDLIKEKKLANPYYENVDSEIGRAHV